VFVDLVGEIPAHILVSEGVSYARTEDGLFRVFHLRVPGFDQPIPVLKFNDLLYYVVPLDARPRTELEPLELDLILELRTGSERRHATEAKIRQQLPSTIQIVKKLRSELENAPKIGQQLRDLQRSSFLDEDEFIHWYEENLKPLCTLEQRGVEPSYLRLGPGTSDSSLSTALASDIDLPPAFANFCVSWLRDNDFTSAKSTRETDLAAPMHFAALHGEVALMAYLIKQGASTNAKDGAERTPLHYAADHQRTEAVKFLLLNGAEPNLMSLLGYTPLHYAALRLNKEIITILLAVGADLELKLPPFSTPLSVAISKCQPEFVSWLISKGASIKNVETNYLGSAAYQACSAGEVETLKILLAAGEDMHYLHRGAYADLITCASYRGHLKVVTHLHEMGLPIDKAPAEGWRTPMVAAVEGGSMEVVKWLKTKGVSLNQSYKGQTLIQIAKAAHKCPPQLVSWVETQMASSKKMGKKKK